MTPPGPRRPPGARRDRHRRRRGGPLLAAATLVAGAWALAGCASADATALALQACDHVDRSLTLYAGALHQGDPARAGAERAAAQAQLRLALPTAATAAGEDSDYQALMSTLAESDHLPESLLVHALSAQCAAARSGGLPDGSGTGTGGTGAASPPGTGSAGPRGP